ncbi:hypothetical protein HNR60_003057 [Rhodopseudomonas rhenobacensis]|uniref:Sensory transduction regulator n=1 Tax=Rhodopseudomonas rhenobacensis TaxID=87461 RepID=A0A7W7Z5C3_9BRAD|nr:YbjN domain-containing protein [Rhodopseudomonas rhenobacensis]MBB5048294.1 hypothetical protein [Rhodopseudomonas rhenobacensis]
MSDLTMKLTLDVLRDVLQQAGYRVETLTDPVANVAYVRSATGGLAFDIRPGNRLAGPDQSFVDVAFTAVLQIQGELPLDVVNRWNATRRFARLQLSQPFLVFCLDVSVAGGVTQDYLRAQIEIWDQLVQQLIAFLRDELKQLSVRETAAAAADQQAALPSAPAHDKAAQTATPALIQ